MAHHGRFKRLRAARPRMTEVFRIYSGTKMARDDAGRYFPVPDDDPRGTYTLVNDFVVIDGVQQFAPFKLAPVRGDVVVTWPIT